MIHKRSVLQKAVSLLLTFSLLAPTVGITALAEPAAPEQPQVRVVGTLTDGGKYLELGLNIDSKTDLFQQAGVLLRYKPDMLSPRKWGEFTDETIGEADIPIPHTQAVGAWSVAEVLPTKNRGNDDLTGKMAKTVKLSDTAAEAYLFLSAEAPLGRKLVQTHPAATESPPEALTVTPSGKPIAYADKAETPTDQAMTARFLVGSKAGGGRYELRDLAAAVDVVVYDKANPNADELALLKGSPLVIPDVNAAIIEGSCYMADNSTYASAGVVTPSAVSFLWVATGQTVDSGGGGVDLLRCDGGIPRLGDGGKGYQAGGGRRGAGGVLQGLLSRLCERDGGRRGRSADANPARDGGWGADLL